MSIIHDTDLADVLTSASDDDVRLLIDVITDKGEGRISLSSSSCRQLHAAQNSAVTEFVRGLVAEELTRFGGNSLMNMLRGGSGVPYKELLGDVASHVGVSTSAMGNCAKMEMAVIAKVLERSLSQMNEEERKTFFDSVGASYQPGMGNESAASLVAHLMASGSTYLIAAMVASAVMSGLIGRGVVLAGGAALGRGLAVLTGPVGWAITGIWTAFDLASPAYRVTVPCVVQIGYMRQKMLNAPACPHCGAQVTANSKFCGNCGARLILQLTER